MKTFYFTFGSDERYPFQNGWVEIDAPNLITAQSIFRCYWPDRTEGILNYAFHYTKEEFLNHDWRGYKCFAKIPYIEMGIQWIVFSIDNDTDDQVSTYFTYADSYDDALKALRQIYEMDIETESRESAIPIDENNTWICEDEERAQIQKINGYLITYGIGILNTRVIFTKERMVLK